MGDADAGDEPTEPRTHYTLAWQLILGGAHVSHGGRFKILRRGPREWMLTDTSDGRQLRLTTLGDAKDRAEWILNNPR